MTLKARKTLHAALLECPELRCVTAERAGIHPTALSTFVTTGRLGLHRLQLLAKALGYRVEVRVRKVKKG